jgi:deoxyribose-phosphate aldolase
VLIGAVFLIVTFRDIANLFGWPFSAPRAQICDNAAVFGLIILLSVSLALLWAGSVIAVAWMLTHPPRKTYAAAVSRGRPGDPGELSPARPFERWTFSSSGMNFPVWEIRGNLPDGGPIIVLSHGWADSRIGGLLRVGALAPLASRLILWDGRGHGEAPGACTLGTREVDDLLALLEQLPETSPRILYGWSLGAGVSIAAAARGNSIASVIAESPYRLPLTPARNVLRARGLPHRSNLRPAFGLLRAILGHELAEHAFDRAAHAAKLRCPLLVLHGHLDEVCPLDDGRAIAGSAGGRLTVLPGGRHNNLWTDPALADLCRDELHAFISRAVETRPRPWYRRAVSFAPPHSPTVDKVTLETRAASFTKRSIKTDAKLAGLLLVFSMIDLTTLEGKDSPEKVRSLCRKAIRPYEPDEQIMGMTVPSVAAVCVYPALVPIAKESLAGSSVKVAAVATGFPSGQYPLSLRLQDTHDAVNAGADEIDMVINRGAFLAGRYAQVFDEIELVKAACGPAHLKVILETGELETYDNIRRASDLAIAAGADFIKTSTGKVQPAATIPVTLVMLEAIRDCYLQTGRIVGMKPAGGIRTAKQALHYLVMLKETLGDGWLTPDRFRIGASTLVNDILRQVVRLGSGCYAAGYDFSEA